MTLANLVILISLSAAPSAADTNYSGANWLQRIQKGYVPYHQLTLQDFRVVDRVRSDCDAYTMGFIEYSYTTEMVGKGPFVAKLKNLTVWSGLDKNQTWRKRGFMESGGFITHEQGHLDINEIAAASFASLSLSTLASGFGDRPDQAMNDLKRKMNDTFNRYLRSSLGEQERYDRETRGGLEPIAQAKWSNYIQSSVKSAGIKAVWQTRP